MSKKERQIQELIYIILAVFLLLCLGKMSYGFYQFVRFLAFAGFSYLAYLQHKFNETDRMFLFGILALLFQPFFPIALGKTMWTTIDVIIAGYLIYLIVRKK